MRARAAAVLCLLALSACEDLREYHGDWTGGMTADPHLNRGFAPGTTVNASVESVNRSEIRLALTVIPGGGVGMPSPALPFLPISAAAGDILADMQLPGEPLRTYLGFVQPPGETGFLTVVSLYPENRMEMRLIRGPNDAYGVFFLRRVLPAAEQPVSK
jgi:hypothetical protein